MHRALFWPICRKQQQGQMGSLLLRLVEESDVNQIIIWPQKGEAG